jgi:hypothetical protein
MANFKSFIMVGPQQPVPKYTLQTPKNLDFIVVARSGHEKLSLTVGSQTERKRQEGSGCETGRFCEAPERQEKFIEHASFGILATIVPNEANVVFS